MKELTAQMMGQGEATVLIASQPGVQGDMTLRTNSVRATDRLCRYVSARVYGCHMGRGPDGAA